MCKIAYYAGLRVSEITGLYSIDITSKSLNVNKQLNGKTGKISDTKSENGNRIVPTRFFVD